MKSATLMMDICWSLQRHARRKKENPLPEPPYPATGDQPGKTGGTFPPAIRQRPVALILYFSLLADIMDKKRKEHLKIWPTLSTHHVPYAFRENIKRCLTGPARKQWPEKPVCTSRRLQRNFIDSITGPSPVCLWDMPFPEN